jgi:NADH:ubiquinone oxidoreductase subunit E
MYRCKPSSKLPRSSTSSRPRCRTRCRSTGTSSKTNRAGELDELLEHLCHKLHLQPGETTADGRLTLEYAECLGACEQAPCMLANEELIGNVTHEQADKFVDELK